MIKLAFDVMSGDLGPRPALLAAVECLAQQKKLFIYVVGDQEVIEAILGDAYPHERMEIKHASQVISMAESPLQALRMKDSSMLVALHLVNQGVADACISAGNTAALTTLAHKNIKLLPGVLRPAFTALFPTIDGGFTRLMDLGANVDCTEAQLQQFALIGSILAEHVDNIPKPRVALLNIGVEEGKGNCQVKSVSELLKNMTTIHYTGYVEASDIYNGVADVVICDGFVGNIVLKTSEGLAKLITKMLVMHFSQNIFYKIIAIFVKPAFKKLMKQLDPTRRNGAILVGLSKLVIKSHGAANQESFKHAIWMSRSAVENRVNEKIELQIKDALRHHH